MNPFTLILVTCAVLVWSRPQTNRIVFNVYNNSTGTFQFSHSDNLDSRPPPGFNNITLWYQCYTTLQSPHSTDVRNAALELQNAPLENGECWQTNPWGSRCTVLARRGDAAIGLCGDKERKIQCSMVVEAGMKIADVCVWKGLAGGRVGFSLEESETFVVQKPRLLPDGLMSNEKGDAMS